MRSIYGKILVWCLGMLLAALFGFAVISAARAFRGGGLGGYLERINLAAFEEVRSAYETGGPEKLKSELDRMDRVFETGHYLLDSRGQDLITGRDLSDLASMGKSVWGFPGHKDGRFIITRTSRDGRYLFVGVAQANSTEFWLFFPYYVVVLAVFSLLCWALALSIARPLHRLTATVERFGGGDLRARASLKRKDEIGKLGNAFDHMADRIETLVSAERRLLQDISHELRSPLSRLSFAAELVPSAADPAAAAVRVKKEVHRLSDLVGALVEMTRAEGEASIRNPEPLKLDTLLREIVEDCGVEAEVHGCALEFSVNGDAQLWGDPELLRRAFENVIRNAITYSPPGQRVEIRLNGSETTARVWVRDHGPGVPEEYLAKIFQPFFRTDSAREAATGGVGLGLAIAQRAVTLHHGTVAAANATPGLEIAIELPMTISA